MAVVEFDHVWKKFRKGEKFNSLRDTIPAFFKSRFRKPGPDVELEEREFWAVRDVSFSIGRGEVVGIIGPNGAGKSTILKLLSGILSPNKGRLAIHGRLSALIEVTAGFHPELTGRENVYLNGTILGMKKKEIDAKFDEIVAFSGIGEFIDTPVKRYSSGMFSRLGFSVAAHVDPEVLLVDEVLAVGDIAFQAKCAQKMRELLDSGVTIVIVSHNLALIQSLCRRVILLNRGEVVQSGPPDEVVPVYENLIFSQQEKEVKEKIQAERYKVKVKDASQVSIAGVEVKDAAGARQESFHYDDELLFHVRYDFHKPVPNPVFMLEILRADGVVCCCKRLQGKAVGCEQAEGGLALTWTMKKLNLAPGLYIPRVSVWDSDIIHPFCLDKSVVFKVEAGPDDENTGGIFRADIQCGRKVERLSG